MFQSHLDEHPIMTSASALGEEPTPVPAGSRDVVIPQAAAALARYKPMITIILIAVAAYVILKTLKKKKIAPDITG